MNWQQVKGLLIDLDGVIYIDEQPISGAVETIHWLKENGYPVAFVTNTSNKSIATIHKSLITMGIPVEPDEIISAAYATALFVKKERYERCFAIVDGEVKPDFEGTRLVEENADAVVIGDIGRNWNYDLVNRAFNELMNGADLIAMHKGASWQTSEGLRLDIGAYVAGLEYAAGKEAEIVGKPNASFFRMALNKIGVAADEAVMIGDDINSDVGGALKNGLCGVQVKTGKYRPETMEQSPVEPDDLLESIADLPERFS